MSHEILSVLEYMEKEKGIARDAMIQAMLLRLRLQHKNINTTNEIRVEINPKSGALKAWNQLEVVDSVSDSQREIHIDKARQMDSEATVGGLLRQKSILLSSDVLPHKLLDKLFCKEFANLKESNF